MKPLRFRMKAAAGALLIGAGSMLLYACLNPVGSGYRVDANGGSDNPVAPPTYFVAKVQPIFDGKCIQCHTQGGAGWSATGGSNGGLDLTAGKSYASLVNDTVFEKPTKNPVLRVKPGSADSSYLYHKVSLSTDQLTSEEKTGGQMPLGGAPLSGAELAIIKTWIDLGASQ